DAVGTHPLLPFRLQEDAPLTAEAIELVDEQPAQKRLHRLIHVGQRDAFLEHLVLVDVYVDLRDRRAEWRGDAAQLGTLARSRDELLDRGVEIFDRPTRSILKPEAEAAL